MLLKHLILPPNRRLIVERGISCKWDSKKVSPRWYCKQIKQNKNKRKNPKTTYFKPVFIEKLIIHIRLLRVRYVILFKLRYFYYYRIYWILQTLITITLRACFLPTRNCWRTPNKSLTFHKFVRGSSHMII